MSVSANFRKVVKRYDKNTVIEGLDLNINKGEFFTLLGPSGCGKTTLLRMVAGFNSIDGGDILIDDQPISRIPAYKRNMGMVFQNYAIFPHMTVFDNVAYGLKARKIAKADITSRVEQILNTMQIDHLRDRFPKNISGGQRQRVALARALVITPSMLLMDEPLSNLDAKLRIDMRMAIKKIQKDVGITTIYVTHDQEEALAISDRIAVMNKGIIQQVDTPFNVYKNPSNIFVATFIGHTNLFKGTCSKGGISLDCGYFCKFSHAKLADESKVTVGVRPERFILLEKKAANSIRGKVELVTFLGQSIHYQIRIDATGQEIELEQDITNIRRLLEAGEEVMLQIDVDNINVFTTKGKRVLLG